MGEAGGGLSYPDSDDTEPADRWFARLGPCLVCGVPGADQRHRVIEAIAGAVAAGDGEEDVAREYEVPVEAVRAAVQWAAEHPDGLEHGEMRLG
jgi:hypothetical protein